VLTTVRTESRTRGGLLLMEWRDRTEPTSAHWMSRGVFIDSRSVDENFRLSHLVSTHSVGTMESSRNRVPIRDVSQSKWSSRSDDRCGSCFDAISKQLHFRRLSLGDWSELT
jgi:hypothetical protein